MDMRGMRIRMTSIEDLRRSRKMSDYWNAEFNLKCMQTTKLYGLAIVSVLQKELVGLDCRLPFLIHLAIRNKDGQNDKNKCP
jgi:hypothetical protein